MLLGRVTGTVVASRKEPLTVGWKLLVVRQLDAEDKETGGYVVAADAVGAGVGASSVGASASASRKLFSASGRGIRSSSNEEADRPDAARATAMASGSGHAPAWASGWPAASHCAGCSG